VPAQAVPALPVPVGLRVKVPGSAIEPGSSQPVSKGSEHDGANLMEVMVIGAVLSSGVELFCMSSEPATPVSPTVTVVGKVGVTDTAHPCLGRVQRQHQSDQQGECGGEGEVLPAGSCGVQRGEDSAGPRVPEVRLTPGHEANHFAALPRLYAQIRFCSGESRTADRPATPAGDVGRKLAKSPTSYLGCSNANNTLWIQEVPASSRQSSELLLTSVN
jgi:hypothetical protein